MLWSPWLRLIATMSSMCLLAGCGTTLPSAPATDPPPATAAPQTQNPSAPRSTAPSEEPQRVVLTTAGDWNWSSATRAVLQRIAEVEPDANVMVGDLSYGKNGEEGVWCDRVKTTAPDVKELLVSGNHESNGRNGRIENFVKCLPAPMNVSGDYGRRYYVDLPARNPIVRLVLISPGLDFGGGKESYAKGTEDYAWTKQAIAGARSGGIGWVIVAGHRPCITMGRYACTSGRDLNEMLLAEKVDVLIQGHEHLYQRSKQLTLQSGCKALGIGKYDADCVVDADDELQQGAGTVAVTVGTGGTKLRDIYPRDKEAGYFVTASGKNESPAHGFLQLTVTNDAITAVFDNAGTGTFTDSFTITRR